MLLSWKNLGQIASLDSLVTWAKNESATITRRRKTQEFVVIFGKRHRSHYVVKVAREAPHGKKN